MLELHLVTYLRPGEITRLEAPNFDKVLPYDEEFNEGNPKALNPKWYPVANTLFGSTRIANMYLYEVIEEVELVPASHVGVGPSQPVGIS